jgi:two-component system, cell cycle sensor histidine kinase and response regulator CckA
MILVSWGVDVESNDNNGTVSSQPLSNQRRRKLRAAQIRLLHGQSGIGLLGAFLGSVILGGVLWNVVPHNRIIAWVLAYAAVFLGRQYLLSSFHRQRGDDDSTIRWGKWHTLVVNAGGLLWGVAAVWLFPEDSIMRQLLLCIFVAGIAAAAAIIYSPTGDYAVNVLLALVPLAGRFIYELDEFHVTIGGVILLFATALLLTGRRMHKLYADSLRLRSDKEELVEDLKHEIDRRDLLEADLTKARDGLETQVEKRTSELATANRSLQHEIVERKQAQEALRQSEELYRAVFENAGIGIGLLDSDCRMVKTNRALSSMLGYSAEEFNHLSFLDITHPDDREISKRKLGSQIAGEIDSYKLEKRYLKKNGDIVWTRLWSRAIRDANGEIVGTVGVIEDVTERKQAEEALRESEEKFSTAFRSAPNPMMISSLEEGTIIEVNDEFVATYGYERSEVEGKAAIELEIWKDADERSSWLQQVNSKGHARNVEVSISTKDGRPRLGLLSTVTIQLQGKPFLLNTCNDITERSKAEEALRKSEERLELALKAGDLGLWDLHIPTGMGFASQRTAEIVGYSLDEVEQNLSFWESLLHPDDRPKAVKRLYDHLAGLTDYSRQEYRMRHKSGDWKWVLSRGKVVEHDPDGKPLRMIGTFEDITERKKTEEKLHESEARYRLLVENVNDAIFVAQDGFLKSPNYMLALMTGYEVNELDEQPFTKFIHPEDTDMVLDRHRQRVNGASGLPSAYQFRVLKKDGNPLWVELSAALIEWEGRPATLNVLRDVTVRKDAEEALEESEQRLRQIIDFLPDATLAVDIDGRVIAWNRAIEEMTGVAAKEMMGKANYEYALPFYGTRRPILLDLVLKPNEEMQQTYSFFMADRDILTVETDNATRLGQNTVLWAKASALYDMHGSVIGAIESIRDITDRKRAEEALLTSETKYRALFEESKDAIYLTDRDGTLVQANQAFLDLFGFSREDAKDLNILAIYGDPADRTRFQETIERLGSLKDYEVKFQKQDGTEIDCLLTFTLRLDKDETILGYQGIARDITERKGLEKQLLQAQKMEAVGTLAGGIAHDFNNLLTVVQGFSELLLAEKDQKHPEYGDLEKIFHAAKSGAELVKRLLMFSRQSGLEPVPMDLNKRIVQVEKLLRRTIPRMVDITLELTADLPRTNADPSQIEQILMNLALNARDAMPDVGKLTLKTSIVTLDEEYCRLHVEASPGEYVVLEVSDTGHGMDKETVEHIFEPFFTTKEMGRGTGLGLAMVYGIVKQHNGHITVYSEVGKGTTFQIYLPAIPGEAETGVEKPEEALAFGTETVLLADDEEFVRELGARILTKHGYTALQAEDGKKALDLFKKKRSQISLVILDLIMPEMSGAECLKELLKIDPNVRVLIASGYSADTSLKEAIQTGAKGFVSKPFRVKELLRDVRNILDEG